MPNFKVKSVFLMNKDQLNCFFSTTDIVTQLWHYLTAHVLPIFHTDCLHCLLSSAMP